jgi:hypothetical protein
MPTQTPVQISGLMLRRSGDHAIVEIEIEGRWVEVIREFIDAPFSHIVEPGGMRAALMHQALPALLAKAKADGEQLRRDATPDPHLMRKPCTI